MGMRMGRVKGEAAIVPRGGIDRGDGERIGLGFSVVEWRRSARVVRRTKHGKREICKWDVRTRRKQAR